MLHINLKAKTKVEDCLTISIFSLHKQGTLKHSNSGTISWLNPSGSNSKINYLISLNRLFNSSIELQYITTDNSGKQKNINQTFLLHTTPCIFGGKRGWFICLCGKRVAVLYKPRFADNFACRRCYNLTYESRNLSKNFKGIGKPLSIPELDALRDSVRRIFYNGKFTKRFIKFKTKVKQFETYHDTWLKNFYKKFPEKKMIT